MLHRVDIDGDGLKDLVTGRRYVRRAHPRRGGKEAPTIRPYLYWFQAKRRQGRPGDLHAAHDRRRVRRRHLPFAVANVNGDGLPDIVVANKKSVHLFLQRR